MNVNQRLAKLEKQNDVDDWRLHLPEGVTVAQAEAAADLWARLMAQHPEGTAAASQLLLEAIRRVEAGQTDDDDDDE